jgi:hypothetical protein
MGTCAPAARARRVSHLHVMAVVVQAFNQVHRPALPAPRPRHARAARGSQRAGALRGSPRRGPLLFCPPRERNGPSRDRNGPPRDRNGPPRDRNGTWMPEGGRPSCTLRSRPPAGGGAKSIAWGERAVTDSAKSLTMQSH